MKNILCLVIFILTISSLQAQNPFAADSLPAVPGKIYRVVQKWPEYDGGEAGMLKFVQTNTHYPDDAREIGIQGRVIVGFIVNADGSLDSVRALMGVWPSMDAEAVRVVKMTEGNWKPGMQMGEPVRVRFVMPIMMKLSADELTPLVNPDMKDNNERKANQAYKNGNYDKALKLYQSVCNLDTANNFAAQNLGLCLYRTGDKGGACAQWKKLKDKKFDPVNILVTKYCSPPAPVYKSK